ncbi:LTA synthase family protein [Peribacillus deserti]|uniref:Sulfatase N-terminal domain-containing protein n=1 Tax=Peribacillus deserti TaxID=673318 RepID=A0A2N5M8D1_9BACI|nr:LTA synthase family protein [Peribacillus deserti]PLT30606.1 hypothetical protein CUU66_07105 [Peribacillus deserti]
MKNVKTISLPAIFIFLSLILKSFYVKIELLKELTITGMLAEISVIGLIILVLSFYLKKGQLFSFILLDLIYTSLCLSALLFFDYYNTIFTYKSLTEIDQLGTIKDSILALFNREYLVLFADFPLLLVLPALKFQAMKFETPLTKKAAIFAAATACTFVSLGLTKSTESVNELSKYDRVGLVGYQFLEAGAEIQSHFIAEQKISAETLEKKRRSTQNGPIRLKGMAEGKNVIIVQLESVQQFLINLEIDGKPVTPNLNKLTKNSLYFPNVYTQVGKGNTSDAEFITNTSLYALGDIPMSSAVEGKTVPSLPRVLGQLGYQTATFHANSVSFWNRKNLYKSLGFNHYYDKKYFGTSDVISYGVSDEVMYRKTTEKLAEFHESNRKFYAHVIALSSHFPYRLPEEKKNDTLGLPKRYKDTFVGSYIEAVSYADYAFGRFVDHLKKAGLYDDTLIVVYGDHQGVQTKSPKDQELLKEIFGREYYNPLDHLNIPLIMKVPGITKGRTIETTGGLVDIYPTAANVLGLDLSKQVVFGNDLTNTDKNTVGIRFYAPTGTFINERFGFLPGKTKNDGIETFLKSRKTIPASEDSVNSMNQILKYMKQSDSYVESLK